MDDQAHTSRRETGGLHPTDVELVHQARGGDRGAFDLLVERHARGLFELAALMIGNRTDAQDLVQETLLGAFQGLHRFEARASVRTWLVRILVRQTARHRRHQRYRRTQSLDDAADPSAGDRGLAYSPGTAASDARMDLMTLLGRLSPEHRQVLVLRELEDLSYDQIAELLAVPRGTVESRLFRARAMLRQVMDESAP